MNLSGLLNHVVNALTPVFAPLPVAAHGGRFTEDELPMLLGEAPCLRVAILGLPRYVVRGRERWSGEVRLAVYCLGTDTPSISRADLAMDTAIRLVDWLPDQRFGLSEQESRIPETDSIRAENIYTGDINNLRVALWGVAWNQLFYFDHGVNP